MKYTILLTLSLLIACAMAGEKETNNVLDKVDFCKPGSSALSGKATELCGRRNDFKTCHEVFDDLCARPAFQDDLETSDCEKTIKKRCGTVTGATYVRCTDINTVVCKRQTKCPLTTTTTTTKPTTTTTTTTTTKATTTTTTTAEKKEAKTEGPLDYCDGESIRSRKSSMCGKESTYKTCHNVLEGLAEKPLYDETDCLKTIKKRCGKVTGATYVRCTEVNTHVCRKQSTKCKRPTTTTAQKKESVTTEAPEPEPTTTTTTTAAPEPEPTTTTTTTAAPEPEPTTKAAPGSCEELKTHCARECVKEKCDNGVGNGSDCRPGRARYNNDDLVGEGPGNPGSKLHDDTVTYINKEKGENRVISDGLDRFVGSLEGTNGGKARQCYTNCKRRFSSITCAPEPEPTTTTTTEEPVPATTTTTTTAAPEPEPTSTPEPEPKELNYCDKYALLNAATKLCGDRKKYETCHKAVEKLVAQPAYDIKDSKCESFAKKRCGTVTGATYVRCTTVATRICKKQNDCEKPTTTTTAPVTTTTTTAEETTTTTTTVKPTTTTTTTKATTTTTKPTTTTTKATTTAATTEGPLPTLKLTTTKATTTTTTTQAATTTEAPSVCAGKSYADCETIATSECGENAECIATYAKFCSKPEIVEPTKCLTHVGAACGVTSGSAVCRRANFKQCLVHSKCKAIRTVPVVTTTPAAPVTTTGAPEPPLTTAPGGRCVGKKPKFCGKAARRICGATHANAECREVFTKHCVSPLPVSRQMCTYQAQQECKTDICKSVHFRHCQKIAKCARTPFPCKARSHEVCSRLSHRVCGFSDRETFCRKVFYDGCRKPTVVPKEACGTRAAKTCGVTALSGRCRKVAFRQCVLLSRCAAQCTSNSDCAAHPTNKCLSGVCLPNGKCQYREKSCSDGVPCTEDSCDAATGECKHAITPRSHATCADNIACTSDSCTPTGCVRTPVNNRCNDKKACTDDVCHPTTGCVNTKISETCEEPKECVAEACDDGKECTVNRCKHGVCDFSKKVECEPGCKPEECRCYHPLCNADSECAHLNDKCHTARCDHKRGACIVDPKPCDKGCEGDHKKCELKRPGTCYQSLCLSNGKCEHHFVPNDSECTKPCDATCKSDDPCVKAACHPETGACMLTPNPGCGTTPQTTSPAPKCVNHEACATNDPCVVGQCDPVSETCKNINICKPGECLVSKCDDGDPCTVDECLPNGKCKPPKERTNICRGSRCTDTLCDDQDPCTKDVCIEAPAEDQPKCVHTPACQPKDFNDKCHIYECKVNPETGATFCRKDEKWLISEAAGKDPSCAICTVDLDCEKINQDPEGTRGICDNFKCKYEPVCKSDTECDTKSPCTVNKCNQYGKCEVVKHKCDDDNKCTLDRCLITGAGIQCSHQQVKCPLALGATGAALDGQCDPKNGCGTCWVKDSCNDNNACTVDECVLPAGVTAGGSCVHTPITGFGHRWYENLWCDPNVGVTREVLLTQANLAVVQANARPGETDALPAGSVRN